MNHRKQFYTYLASLTLVLAVIYFLLDYLTQLILPVVVLILIVAFAALTAFLYKYVVDTTDKSPSRFVTAALGSVTAKLLLSAMFFGVYVFMSKESRVEVGVSLFLVYMSFTTLMTLQIGKYVRFIQDKMKQDKASQK